jgi:hypothetical protein
MNVNFLNMKKSLLLTLVGILLCLSSFSQAPQAFKYQAVVRNNGQIIINQSVGVLVKLLQGSSQGSVVYTEVQNQATNQFGVINLSIGEGSNQTGNFSGIDWSNGPYFLETDIDIAGGANYQIMGSTQLLSVPYALYSNKTHKADQFVVEGNSSIPSDSALFVVKDKNGQPVFAVYETGVEVTYNVNPLSKGAKGGFAVGGRTPGKGPLQRVMQVSTDSIRMYVDTTTAKGAKGGFAVGGRSDSKGAGDEYFSITNSKTPQVVNPSKPKILWYPSKSAFLAGQVLIESPDSVGLYSIAVGDSAKAVGNNSQAFGYKPIARSNYSTAIGNNALASGNVSFALGSGAQASGNYSFAFGSTGLNEDGTASGNLTSASGNYSFAFGQGSSSTGYGSFTYGMNTSASADYSTAIGLGANANGRGSISLGYYTTSQAYKSTIIGTYNKATGSEDPSNWVATDPLFVVGNGTSGYSFIRYLGKGGIIFPILPIYRPPLYLPVPSNAFMLFKNGNAVLGGGNTYYTDQAARLFIFKSNGTSSAYSYNKGIYIREGSSYDYGLSMHIVDRSGYTKMYVSSSLSTSYVMYLSSYNSAGAYALYINGNAFINGAWSSSSDIRWKKNIVPLDNTLEKLAQLDGVHFEWRTSEFPEQNFSKGAQIGVVAQEVEKVFPELVKTDANGYKSVMYDRLGVIAISAIKQQQIEIEKLQTTVDLLQKENAQLKSMQAEIDQLKAMLNKK